MNWNPSWVRSLFAAVAVGLFCLPGLGQDFEVEDPDNPLVRITTNKGEIVVELLVREAPKTVANFIGLAEGTREFTDPKTGETVKRPFYDGLIFHRVIDQFMIQGGCPLGNGRGGPGFDFEDEINAAGLGLDKEKAVTEEGAVHASLLVFTQDDFNRKIVAPLLAKMGIKSQEELQAQAEEVSRRLYALTVKEALENLGYRYDDSHPSRPPLRGCLAMANSGPATNGSQFFINLVDTPHLTGKHTVFGRVVAGMEVVDAIGKVATKAGDRPVEDVVILTIRKVAGDD